MYNREIQIKCGYVHCYQKSVQVKGFCSSTCKDKQNTLAKNEKIKEEAVEYLGGKCKRCNFNELESALIFHHLDPFDKQYEISTYMSRGVRWLKPELDKCVLLCKNCHEVVHATKDSNYFNLNRYCFGTNNTNFKTIDYCKTIDKCTEDPWEIFDGSVYDNPVKRNLIPSDTIIHS